MRLSRRLSLGLLLLAGLPAAASATATRVRSLGGDGDFFEDTANVLRWYGCLPSYGNTAVLELGEFDPAHGATAADQQAVRQGAGAHIDLGPQGRDGTVAAYLFRSGERADQPGAMTLMYGRKWGGTQVALLAAVDEADFVADVPQGVRRDTSLRLCWGLGARFDLGSRSYADLAGEWRGSRVEYARSDLPRGIAQTSWGSYGLRARAVCGGGRTWALIPAISYDREARWEAGAAASSPPDLLDSWTKRAGLGVNLFPTGDLLGIAAIEGRWGRERIAPLAADGGGPGAVSLHYFNTLVARLGLEARLRPWLTLRGGVLSTAGFRGWTPPRNLGLRDDFDLTLGLGLHLGDFDADFLLNDDALFNAGSIVTNAGSGERSTFSSVSLAYQF